MKLSPNSNPPATAGLLIRLHNQVGAAVDVTGHPHGDATWTCHGCGEEPYVTHDVGTIRERANAHANECRAAYHHLT